MLIIAPVVQDATAKECGLHSGNVVRSASEQARDELPDLWPSGPVEALSRDQLAALKAGPRDKDTLVVLYAPWCQFSQVMEGSYDELAQRLQGGSVRVAKFQADTERDFATGEFGLATFPTIGLLPKSGGPWIKYPSERRDADTLGMWVKTVAGYE